MSISQTVSKTNVITFKHATAALSIGHFLCIRMGGEDRLVEGKLAHVRFEANSLWILPASG